MIYLDNSATTFPKPSSVVKAVNEALIKYGANPGRSGHTMSLETANEIYKCRKSIAKLINYDYIENIIFVRNCTEAINIVLKGKLKSGDHVVVSCLEHNAVMRPLKRLSDFGINYTMVQVFEKDDAKTLLSFKNSIQENTKLIVCMHASNVWGIRLPIEQIAEMAHTNNIEIMVDAAQSAGVLPIDFKGMGLDYLCLAGHKGLYGPMGTGVLVIKEGNDLRTFIEGGTGSDSLSLKQPLSLPDRFESGTPNVSGICGLRAGVDFVENIGISNIHKKEIKLITSLYDNLKNIDKIKLYTKQPNANNYAPVLSFNVDGIQSETVATELNNYNIAVRAGLHCAPLAHKYMGTLGIGAVRLSPSYFTNIRQIEQTINVIKKIVKKF